MNNNLTGAPKTVVNISDASNLVAPGLGGYICVQGETLRGLLGKAQFVASANAFALLYGGLHPDSPFVAYCLRLLAGGVKLYVLRAAHYTDVTDLSTAQGAKATATYTTGGAAASLTVAAKYPGLGYNGTQLTVANATSLQAGRIDVTLAVPGGATSTVYNLPAALDADAVGQLNAGFTEFTFSAAAGTLGVGSIALAGGAQDVSLITATDYAGDRRSGAGWYGLSTVVDAFRVANIHRPTPEHDAGLLAYVMSRGDMRCHFGFPTGANAQGHDDYRMGTGAYTQTPLDSLYGSYWGGALNAPLTTDAKSNLLYPGIIDFLVRRALVDADDRQGPWFSAAGYDNATQLFNRGVQFNLTSPDNSDDYDRIYPHGINALVQDTNELGAKVVMPWGNRSALLDNTKITSKENVADLCVYLVRALRPYMKRGQFKPDSPKMWKDVYRKVKPFLIKLEDKEAIVAGEGTNWFWLGDQDADTRTDAVYNSQADLAAGKYRARFVFLPIAATEYIALDLVATDANSITATISTLNASV